MFLSSLIYPMFAMVILTFVVLIIMFRTRVSAVRQGKMQVNYFKTYDTGNVPRNVAVTQRHFSNLFELPVLFYVGCLAAMILQMDGTALHFWAWAFVIFRIFHAVIHLTSNKITPRMLSYLFSWIVVLGLWGQLVLAISMR